MCISVPGAPVCACPSKRVLAGGESALPGGPPLECSNAHKQISQTGKPPETSPPSGRERVNVPFRGGSSLGVLKCHACYIAMNIML
eukprot:5890471-Pyramimonas_sp.AAC.1